MLLTNEETVNSFEEAENKEVINNKERIFTLFPNPNSGTFQLETNFPIADIALIKITNLLGVTVYETQNLVSKEISLQNSGAGLYFVVVVLKNGKILTQKMMVQR